MFKGKRILEEDNINLRKKNTNNLVKASIILPELAKEISKGPDAEEGRGIIPYSYDSIWNIYLYFNILHSKSKGMEILCLPNILMKTGKYILPRAFSYNIDNKTLDYPEYINEKIEKCFNDKKIQFIYFFFGYTSSGSEIYHANMVVIDLHHKTIERFDSGGGSPYDDQIDKLFKNEIQEVLGLEKFNYWGPRELGSYRTQRKETDSYCGMCVTFSMFYLHLRILNPDMRPDKLIKYLQKLPPSKLKDMILKYAKKIEETIKDDNNSDIINDLIEDINLFYDNYF